MLALLILRLPFRPCIAYIVVSSDPCLTIKFYLLVVAADLAGCAIACLFDLVGAITVI
jgi:hypothetical protein